MLRDVLKQVDADYLVRENQVVVYHRQAIADAYEEPKRDQSTQAYPITSDLDVNFEPGSDAFQQLADNSGMNVVVDGMVLDKFNPPIKLTLHNVPPSVAVRTIAQLAGLRVIYQPHLFFVTTKHRAEQLKNEDGPVMAWPRK